LIQAMFIQVLSINLSAASMDTLDTLAKNESLK